MGAFFLRPRILVTGRMFSIGGATAGIGSITALLRMMFDLGYGFDSRPADQHFKTISTMRDFKCKARSKDNNEWVYGYVDETMYHDLTVVHTDYSTIEVYRDTVEFLGTKDLLLEFFQWLDRRGMLDNTLCYDPEHQIETFIELRERKGGSDGR